MVQVYLLILLVCLPRSAWLDQDYYDYLNLKPLFNLRGHTATTEKLQNLSRIFFPSLHNYDWKCNTVSEVKYPWIARVIHSTTRQIPHVCTAVCIDRRIFISAARCIYNLKLQHTTVIYQFVTLSVKAFVLTSRPTKQYFDDIAFIVVNEENLLRNKRSWVTIALFEGKRTDKAFKWFADLDVTDVPLRGLGKNVSSIPLHKVVGYATPKYLHRLKVPETEFHLSELEVMVGIKMCSVVYTLNKTNNYFVPCYLPCSIEEYPDNPKCKKYHGVEGGAIFDIKTQKLFGIATWGGSFQKYDLPVGFSVPNSANFYEDLTCARRIRNDKTDLSFQGFFQALCSGYIH